MGSIDLWKLIDSEYVLNNKYCKVRKDTVKLPNGRIIDDYFVNERPDVAIVLALNKKKEIILVRQYRHAIREILIELPAGTFDKTKENPEDCAKRELLEETGYEAEKLIPLGSWYDYPTKDTHMIYSFFAQLVEKKQEPQLDPNEQIELKTIKLKKVLEMIKSGQIKVSGTIATILLAIQKDYI